MDEDTQAMLRLLSLANKKHPRWRIGHLEANKRWISILESSGYFASPTPQLSTSDAKKAHLAGMRQCFDFPALLPELQLAVIEWLDYADLKCLELVSRSMQDLVNHPTRCLDKTLFRSSTPPLSELLEIQRSHDGKKSERGRKQQVFELHPIAVQCLEKVNLEPGSGWRSLCIWSRKLVKNVQQHRKTFIHSLAERSENATYPACTEMHVTMWTEHTELGLDEVLARVWQFGDPGIEEINNENDDGLIVEMITNNGAPVTLEQLVKTIGDTFEKIRARSADHPGVLEDEMEAWGGFELWDFLGWERYHIDEGGRLCLSRPLWTPDHNQVRHGRYS